LTAADWPRHEGDDGPARSRGAGRAGDHDAFALLVRESIARLEAVARLILRDHELASDAVRRPTSGPGGACPGFVTQDRLDAWLHRLTVNASLDASRRRRRRPIEVELTPVLPPSVGDGTGSVADRDQLERGFRCLRPEHRAVLVLHYYVGMSVPGIADVLGIPLGTAQSRLGRALAALREALGKDREPETTPVQAGQIA
jgi:RNA polymerase sigma-70 factor (ECF subfamily)